MTTIEKEMIKRFGEDRVQAYTGGENDACPLLLLELEKQTPVTVIMTNGLSDKTMHDVPEKYNKRRNCELYFCLPSYWDWEDIENPNMNWIFHWIQRFAKYLKENETWYGPGHTFPTGNPAVAISETMKQNYFMLADPILLESEFFPIVAEGKEVHFYGIIPIYDEEFEYKASKTTAKFLRKFIGRNYSEKLDDYRPSTKKSKFNLFNR